MLSDPIVLVHAALKRKSRSGREWGFELPLRFGSVDLLILRNAQNAEYSRKAVSRYVTGTRDFPLLPNNFSHLSSAVVMRLWSKILFTISGLLFVAFLFFITDHGQEILRGPVPKNATGFQLDDIFMGAGLAPWAWMLAPSIILAIVALAMKRSAKRSAAMKG